MRERKKKNGGRTECRKPRRGPEGGGAPQNTGGAWGEQVPPGWTGE